MCVCVCVCVWRVGGHVFSTDPVGVGVIFGVASCLHSISYTITTVWMEFGRTYKNLLLGGGKMQIRSLVTLAPFSRSH